MSKFVNLEQIKVLANKVKSEDAALGTKLETVTTKVDNLVAAGGEANILEGVKVNGAALAISDKMVDILIASGEENGTISVNGAAVAIKGLAALAYKSEITEDELGEALKASIAAKATKADLDALTVRVGDIEKAGYQTAEQVQAAIAASGHAHFEVAKTDPTAEGFEAQANVMYLYMNSKTKHYDIYAKVGESVVLLDDTTVDLSEYAKTADVTSAISAAITAKTFSAGSCRALAYSCTMMQMPLIADAALFAVILQLHFSFPAVFRREISTSSPMCLSVTLMVFPVSFMFLSSCYFVAAFLRPRFARLSWYLVRPSSGSYSRRLFPSRPPVYPRRSSA